MSALPVACGTIYPTFILLPHSPQLKIPTLLSWLDGVLPPWRAAPLRLPLPQLSNRSRAPAERPNISHSKHHRSNWSPCRLVCSRVAELIIGETSMKVWSHRDKNKQLQSMNEGRRRQSTYFVCKHQPSTRPTLVVSP